MRSNALAKSSEARWLASDQSAIELDRERSKRSFVEFVRRAWHVIEPERPYVHNWHIDAIGEHLEAITRGELKRVLFNVPPGTAKSLLISVLWQAWEWGPADKPANRFLSTSFNSTPVTRDTRKTRDLILSEWYQQRWPSVQLTRVAETSFANSATGTREGVAFGSLTSQRGDRLCIDDPHSTETAESDAERAATTRKFREGAQNRLNDLERSAIAVIMQRLHEQDISGVILQLGLPYTHVMLPMEFEPKRRCVTRWYADPRTDEGELLFPSLFSDAALADLKLALGDYAWAGQYQQRPAPREGGLFKVERIGVVETLPKCSHWVRAWDLAGTAGAGAYTVGVLMGLRKDGKGYVVADVVRERLSPGDVRTLIKSTAELDGKKVRIRLPQDPGQAGKAQAAEFYALLDGYTVRILVTGDKKKAVRAEPFAVQVEGSRVAMLKAPWNDAYIAELRTFPAGHYADQVDASVDGHGELQGFAPKKTSKLHAPVSVPMQRPHFGGT